MNKKSKYLALFGVFMVAALFLGVLFGAASAAPASSEAFTVAQAERANALLAPASQAVTGSVEVAPAPQGQGETGGDAGSTTQTTNVAVNIPWWVWLVALLLLVVIVALIAGSRSNTTVIKD